MRWIVWFRNRVRSLHHASQLDADLEEELRFHYENEVEAHVQQGVPPEVAARRARLGLAARREECRDARGVSALWNGGHDLKFALRQLRKNPGFTVVALAAISIGLAAAVSLFAFVDAALIRPLPYPAPDRLVSVAESSREIPRQNLSYLDWVDWRRENTTLESLDAYGFNSFLIEGANGVEPLPGARITPGFFRTLGIAPMLGRDFTEEDGTGRVLLTHAVWRARFGEDPSIVGRKITLSNAPFEVIGVLPPGFSFAPLGDSAVYHLIDPQGDCHRKRICHNLFAVGRLQEGHTAASALANLQSIAVELEKRYPDSNRGRGASVIALSEAITGQYRRLLLILMAGAMMLALIAFGNVATLILVRTDARRREIAVRKALGASSGRIVGQFTTEGAILAVAGCGLGLAMASVAIPALRELVPQRLLTGMPFLQGLSLDARAAAFGSLLALGGALLFSLIPALSGVLLRGASMHESSRGASSLGWQRLGSKMVVVEFACALVLLAGAGVVAQSLYRLLHVELGFAPEKLAMVRVAPPKIRYAPPEKRVELAHRLLRRASALPGVEGAAIASTPPVSFNGNTDWVRIQGKPWDGRHIETNYRPVSDRYFEVIGARLVRGRSFTGSDRAGQPPVVIINQSMANKYFPNEDPIGQRIGDIKLSPHSLREIVGVVEDIRDGALEDPIWPATYLPFDQSPDDYYALLVRTQGSPLPALSSLARVVKEEDRGIATAEGDVYVNRIQRSPAAYLHASAMWITGGFAACALLLSSIGLYGVLAYAVSQRTREFGVRMALGADKARIRAMIWRESARLLSVAALIGMAGAWVSIRFLRGFFFGIEGAQPLTAAVALLVLLVAAAIAVQAPVRRAANADPVASLRAE